MKTIFKKVLAIVLSMALMLSCLVLPNTFVFAVGEAEDEAIEYWDGTTMTKPVDSDGDGWVEIDSAAKLAWFVNNNGHTGSWGKGTKAKLTKDIWLNDMKVTVKNGTPTATKASDTSVTIDLADDKNNGLNEWFDSDVTITADGNSRWFGGTIDGDGHVVHGLYVVRDSDNDSKQRGNGLIPKAADGTTVVNLGIENAYIDSTKDKDNYLSAFIVGNATAKAVTVENCYVGASAYHKGKCAATIIGGGDKVYTVKNCYSLATISRTVNSGGVIVGWSWGSHDIIENCYTIGAGKKITNVEADAVNCYVIDAAPGSKAPVTMPNLGPAYAATEDYPVLKIFLDEEQQKYWGGWAETPTAENGVYIIDTPEKLAYFVKNNGMNNSTAKLTKDIWLNDMKVTVTNGTPTATKASDTSVTINLADDDNNGLIEWFDDNTNGNNFGGTIDGDAHVVHGLYLVLDLNSTKHGLIPGAASGGCTVKNLGIEDAYMDTSAGTQGNAVALFVGAGKVATISNCYTGASTYHKGGRAAVFAGGMLGTDISVTDCYTLTTRVITKEDNNPNGAIVGFCSNVPTVTRCYTAHGYTLSNHTTTNSYSISEAPGNKAPVTMPDLGPAYAATADYPVLKIFLDEEQQKYWGGWAETPTAENGVYIIDTPEKLAYFVKNNGINNSTAKLTKDIWLNDMKVTVTNGTPTATKASNTSVTIDLADDDNNGLIEWFDDNTNGNNFGGTIDGDAHVVHGLYLVLDLNSTKHGLIPGAASGGCTVKNLGIEDAYMDTSAGTQGNAVALFVGAGKVATISNCYTGASTYHKGGRAAVFAGGMLGTDISVTDCYTLTTRVITKEDNLPNGAIIGYCTGATTVTRCYTAHGYTLSNKTNTNSYSISEAPGNKAPVTMPDLGPAYAATADYPVLKIFLDEEQQKYWGGWGEQPADSDGDGWVEIDSAEKLYWYVKNNGHTGSWGTGMQAKITKDIWLNDMKVTVDAEGNPTATKASNTSVTIDLADDDNNGLIEWFDSDVVVTADSNTKWFGATIDGDAHVVHGLYLVLDQNITDSKQKGMGLIPKVASGGCTIMNLGIEDAYMDTSADTQKNAAALFVGRGKATVSNCYTGASTYHKGARAAAILGGMACSGANISDCYSLTTLNKTATDATGGGSAIIGFVSGQDTATVTRCYTAHGYTLSNRTNTNSYSISAAPGKDAVLTMFNLGSAFVSTDDYPALVIFAGKASDLDTMPLEGSGTAEAPYLITTADDLRDVIGVAGKGKYYKLTNDIVINDLDKIDWATGAILDENYTPNEWFKGTASNGATYISYDGATRFKGTLDGDGYTVFGLWYSPEDVTHSVAGLVPVATENTYIKNLTLSHSYVTAGRFTGAVSGRFMGKTTGTIQMVTVDDTVTVDGSQTLVGLTSYGTGGFVGWSDGITMTDCGFYGDVNARTGASVYGFIGNSWDDDTTKITTISNSFSAVRQPFAPNAPTYTAENKDDAINHFNNLYRVNNVYTTTHEKDNTVKYKIGEDGTEVKIQNLFEFTEITNDEMKGNDAISVNMPGLAENWYATEGYPVMNIWALPHGDVNKDGNAANDSDYAALRQHLIGAAAFVVTDFNRNGVTDICDLVALSNYEPIGSSKKKITTNNSQI